MTNFADRLAALLKREGTGISWADLTFNPWIGCQKVGPACDHCYAETLATQRLGVPWGPGAERRPTADSTWAKPWRWNRIAQDAGVKLRVFCASLADWADNAVPNEWRNRLANTIEGTPHLTWMLLTKRIGNVAAMLKAMFPAGVPANVWLGVTVANQAEVERDVPRAIEAKDDLGIERLFLSIEPMLGPIDLDPHWRRPCPNSLDGISMDPSTGAYECCSRCDWTGFSDEIGVDLVIVGGESGPKARPMHPEWPSKIQMQCEGAGVVFHFKQWGEWKPWAPGDRGTVQHVSARDGATGSEPGRIDSEVNARADTSPVCKVGVARAGHYLRGVEYRELPAC